MKLKLITSLITGSAALALAAGAPANAEGSLSQELEQLASEGNAEALYHLGMMYLLGEGVAKDQQTAVKLFRQSAELGDPLAAYKLGCFYDGQYQLLEVDFDRALEFKLVAAKAGYALAQQDVAILLYRSGDIPLAMEWLSKAAMQGTAGALQAYASVHNGAKGIEKDPVKAAAYFSLYLNTYGGNTEQRKWLENFMQDLDQPKRDEVASLVSSYHPIPTKLTLQAMSGMGAAEDLVSRSQ
ncbi:MAG: tetratricopeptide repeat protein [Pseudomonadota bacterium]